MSLRRNTQDVENPDDVRVSISFYSIRIFVYKFNLFNRRCEKFSMIFAEIAPYMVFDILPSDGDTGAKGKSSFEFSQFILKLKPIFYSDYILGSGGLLHSVCPYIFALLLFKIF